MVNGNWETGKYGDWELGDRYGDWELGDR